MIKWLIIILLMVPGVMSVAEYGAYNYGAGHYGTNTPPNVTAFTPTDLTPQIDPNTAQDFNVTFVDFDGDTVTISWYVDTVLNATNQNITLSLATGTYTVLANLTDTWNDSSKLTWTVSAEIVTFGFNLTDALIIPSITTNGNLIIIKANITALNKNFSNVYAYLNLDSEFVLLAETPQNKSIANIWTTNVTQVNWIASTPITRNRFPLNITYLQNTTTLQGETENLVVAVEENPLGLEIIVALIFIIGLYVYLARYFTIELFTEHGGIKMLMLIISFWLLMIPLSVATQFNDFNGGPSNVTDVLGVLYVAMMAINIFVTLYFLVWFIVLMVKKVEAGKNG